MKGKKTGGRKAGTPNKLTAATRKVISNTVSDYYQSEQFIQDLAALDPRERLSAVEKLTQYVLHRLNATTITDVTESPRTIEDHLLSLSPGD